MGEGRRLEKEGWLKPALDAYVKDKQWADAARVATALKKPLEAGRYWLEAKELYEAAVCFRRAGAHREAQSALLHVPQSSPRYRDASVHAIAVGLSLGTPTSILLPFLTSFIGSDPVSRPEATALCQFADALREQLKLAVAGPIYDRILKYDPENSDAQEGLAAIEQKKKAATARVLVRAEAPARPRPALPSAPPVLAPPVLAPPVLAPPAAPAGPAGPPAVLAPPSRPAPSASPAPPPRAPVTRPRGETLGARLVAKGKLAQGELEALLGEEPSLATSDVLLSDALVGTRRLGAQELIQTLAELTGMPWIADQKLVAGATAEAARVLTPEQVERCNLVPVKLVDRHLYIAMRDPRDLAVIDQVRFQSGVNHVTGLFATAEGIRRTIDRLYRSPESGPPATDATGVAPVQEAPAIAPLDVLEGELSGHADDKIDLAASADYAVGQYDADLAPLVISGEFSEEGEAVLEVEPESPLKAPRDRPAASAPAPSVVAMQFPPVGALFADRYELVQALGEGGSAAVFKAQDRELNEPVALKLFRPTGQAESEEAVARFKLELSLSRLLTHPNIIRVFDLGFHSGWRYLTMELLEGDELSSKIKALAAPMPIAEGLDYLGQICDGLQAAHEHGVVHRDINPRNLFVTRKGMVKVMDFGIAKRLDGPGVTSTGIVRGTPEFMSPEQITDFSRVDHLTDLYSLGGTAYMIFTGTPPFQTAEVANLILAHLNSRPAPPRTANPEIPQALDELILRLLEKSPAERPQSAAEVAVQLRAIRSSL